MAKTFRCNIVSVKEEIFSGAVEMLIVTGSLGELGILPGHTPLLTGLRPGPVRLRLPSGSNQGDEVIEEVFFASGGFLEVQPTVVTMLTDTVVRADTLDEAAVREAKEKAEKMLSEHTNDFQFSLAAARLAEAAAQLRTLGRYRNQRRG